MTPCRALAILALAIVLPWITLFSVNASLVDGPQMRTHRDRSHCTRACSGYPKHGPGATARQLMRTGSTRGLKTGRCTHAHRASLPADLTGDQGLYGHVIRSLYLGKGGDSVRYGAVNLGVFIVAWPGAMLLLLCLGLRQRIRIHRLKKSVRHG